MDRDDIEALYERMLLGLWHAEDDTLDERAASVAHDELVIHQNGERRHGAGALAGLVRAGRAPFTDVAVRIDTGPVIDCNLVAAQWRFSGAYAGGIPGATAEEGTTVDFTGIDLVRVDDGRVAEYWVCSDGAALMAQLGAQ